MRQRSASWRACLTAVLALGFAAGEAAAQATTVRELARMKDDSEYVLQGLGLVIGLSGTGDSGKELAVARPLAAVMERAGNPLESFDELARSKSVALVMVQCRVPRGGALMNDALDVTVSTLGSASSLESGELYVTVLRGPRPGDPVFATAYGPVVVQNATFPTGGVVREGARMTRDIRMAAPEGSFELVVEPWYRGYTAVSQIAAAVNVEYFNSLTASATPIARAIDDRSIRVEIPTEERADASAFIAEVMSTPVHPELLRVPARVIVNTRTGTIAVAGDVRISPVAITHRGLTITTVIPPPEPTPGNPLVNTERWAGLETDATDRELARLADLQAVFKQLNVEPVAQIEVLQMLKKMGKLHAELVVD